MKSTLLLLTAIVVGANAFGFGGDRAHLNQNASYTCVKSGDWCTLLFFLETTDHLDLIYLEDPDGTGATTAGLYDSDGNGIEGDGSAMSPYKINVTMDCSSFPITLYSPADAIVKVTEPDVFQIRVMAKSVYQPPFYGDVITINDTRYNPMCNCSEAEFSQVTQGFVIGGDINEVASPISESAELKLIWLDFPFFGPTSITNLGNNIYYILVLNPENTAIGAFVFNCYICDMEACNGTQTFDYIDENGCSNINGMSGFYMQGGELRTDVFQAFMLSNQPNLFLSCSVGYCYDAGDARCDNFCEYNTNGRKKRQAEKSNDEEIEQLSSRFTIMITNNPQGSSSDSVAIIPGGGAEAPKPVSQPSSQYVGLMAAVITLSAVLLVGLIVVILVFLHMSRRSSRPDGKA